MIELRGDFPSDLAFVARHTTLEKVAQHWLAQGVDIADVVQQDEFTHDVVVAVAADLVLVYDCT